MNNKSKITTPNLLTVVTIQKMSYDLIFWLYDLSRKGGMMDNFEVEFKYKRNLGNDGYDVEPSICSNRDDKLKSEVDSFFTSLSENPSDIKNALNFLLDENLISFEESSKHSGGFKYYKFKMTSQGFIRIEGAINKNEESTKYFKERFSLNINLLNLDMIKGFSIG